tara:strand:+ start:498 stop:1118 length:621 start_codon:yes stop_codon:yes gene_type:complete
MGTLRVDNLQKEDGSAIITDGVIPSTIIRSSNVGMVKLLSQSNQSAQATYDIDSTYINSTYDDYFFTINAVPSETTVLYAKFFVGGTVVSQDYTWHICRLDSSVFATDTHGGTEMRIVASSHTATTSGGFICSGYIRNVNSTAMASVIQVQTLRIQGAGTSADTKAHIMAGSQDQDSSSSIVNGIRFYMASGTIEVKEFKLYGMVK